jgi:hypothetical protein
VEDRRSGHGSRSAESGRRPITDVMKSVRSAVGPRVIAPAALAFVAMVLGHLTFGPERS